MIASQYNDSRVHDSRETGNPHSDGFHCDIDNPIDEPVSAEHEQVPLIRTGLVGGS